MMTLILLLSLSGQLHTAPGTVITIAADCSGGATGYGQVYLVVLNPVFAERAFFVDPDRRKQKDPPMPGVRCRFVQRGFGLIVVYEGATTNDGRVLTDGRLITPQGW